MRNLLIPSILVAFALIACASDHPTSIRLLPADGAHTASQLNAPVPLTGKCEAVLAAPVFVSPGVIRQVDTGTCQLSHLGKVSFYSAKLINIAAGTQVTEATFTAANGDSIYVSGNGTNTPSGNGLVAFSTSMNFTSGTGRFANVAGEANATGVANLTTQRSSVTLDGWITYAASDTQGP